MKNFKIEFKWAIIFTMTSLLWMLLEKTIGLHDIYIAKHAIYTNLYAIPAIVIYIFALKDKKINFYNNNISWSQGFVSGLYISIIIMILSPLVQYVTFTFITPNFFKNAIEYSVSNKLMKQEMAIIYFNLKNYITQGSIGSLSMGVVTAAIVALFIKSKQTV